MDGLCKNIKAQHTDKWVNVLKLFQHFRFLVHIWKFIFPGLLSGQTLAACVQCGMAACWPVFKEQCERGHRHRHQRKDEDGRRRWMKLSVEIENKKESKDCGEMWALCPESESIDLLSGPKRWITNPPPAFSSSIFPLMSSPSPSSFFLLHSAIHFSALYPGLAVSRARRKIKIYIPCCLLSPPAILKSQNISLSLSI